MRFVEILLPVCFLALILALFTPLSGFSQKLNSNSEKAQDASSVSQVKPKPGSYYSIGTFRFIDNAYKLKTHYSKLKPLITSFSAGKQKLYRVIVGPFSERELIRVEKLLLARGLKDFWTIQIKGSEKILSEHLKTSNAGKRLNSKSAKKKSIYKNSTGKLTKTSKKTKKGNFETYQRVKKKSHKKFNHRKQKLKKAQYKPGQKFRDCSDCPELVVIPVGEFLMGEKNGGMAKDSVATRVIIEKSFAISRFEITFASWDACVIDGGCGAYKPFDEGWGRNTRPVINVNWYDAQKYIDWLTQKTGRIYRLPSEAEWEFGARAGSTTAYWWGAEVGINQAVCQDCGSIFDGEKTAPVGSFSMNKFGLFDTAGNVWEWVLDCYYKEGYRVHKHYPKPLYNIEKFEELNNCSRVLRGGGWDVMALGMSSSFRFASSPHNRTNRFGFRVVREIH